MCCFIKLVVDELPNTAVEAVKASEERVEIDLPGLGVRGMTGEFRNDEPRRGREARCRHRAGERRAAVAEDRGFLVEINDVPDDVRTHDLKHGIGAPQVINQKSRSSENSIPLFIPNYT